MTLSSLDNYVNTAERERERERGDEEFIYMYITIVISTVNVYIKHTKLNTTKLHNVISRTALLHNDL